VGTVSPRNAAVPPSNIALMRPAPSAKRDVGAASGTPRGLCIAGVPQILCALSDRDHLNADGFPLTAKTVRQHLENVKSNKDQKVVCRVAHPISPRGEGVGLQGSGVPQGAIVKVIDMTRLQFRDPVRALDGAEHWANPYQTGTLREYADQVGAARTGAIAHAGSRAEVACYADI
jgi:dihydroxyacid dehydratase/phosphogluconate dehydratase